MKRNVWREMFAIEVKLNASGLYIWFKCNQLHGSLIFNFTIFTFFSFFNFVNLCNLFQKNAIWNPSNFCCQSPGQEIFGKFQIASLSEIRPSQVPDPTTKTPSRLWICLQRKWRAKWIGCGTFREMFRFKCNHIPFVLHSHTLSQVLSLPVRIYGIYPPISGMWEKPSHIPESSPEPHFPGPGLRMGLGSSVCAWQLNNLWCRPCHRLYLSVPPSRIHTHTHTPTHSHAQTHLQSSRTHTIRLLWRSVSHYGLLGLLHYAACLHSHLLIRSTYTHGCGGVSSKSVNIAASWLPVWPTERTRKKTTTPEWQQHQHIHSPTNRTRPT